MKKTKNELVDHFYSLMDYQIKILLMTNHFGQSIPLSTNTNFQRLNGSKSQKNSKTKPKSQPQQHKMYKTTEELTRIEISSLNVKGLKSNLSYTRYFSQCSNIIFLTELWTKPCDLNLINEIASSSKKKAEIESTYCCESQPPETDTNTTHSIPF